MTSTAAIVTSRDGSEIAVHDLGGSGDVVLISHATGLHGRAYKALASCLADRFHVIALDHRAHGDSRAAASWAGDWRGFADDLLSVVETLGLSQPIAFGHSSGGAAVLLAEETEPGTFSNLYCYEPVVYPVDDTPAPSHENALSATASKRREQFSSYEEAIAQYETRGAFATFSPQALEDYVRYGFEQLADGTIRLKCSPSDEARVYAYGKSHHAYTRLGDVRSPVTLAYGSETTAIGREILEPVALRLRRHRLAVLEGLGHFGPLERPDLVAASMIQAIDTPPA